MIPDQKTLWNKKHSNNDLSHYRHEGVPFAKLASKHFPDNAQVLELGCGAGGDALFFAKQGLSVVATDFSEVVITQNQKHVKQNNLVFQAVDISQPLPFNDAEFDVVYAHLSLHYYNDRDTRKIISEIHRVLKPKGILAFACKSTKDRTYGQGEEIEKNIFLHEDHIRHLFDIHYTKDILQSKFGIIKLDEVDNEYADHDSVFIQCIATKL